MFSDFSSKTEISIIICIIMFKEVICTVVLCWKELISNICRKNVGNLYLTVYLKTIIYSLKMLLKITLNSWSDVPHPSGWTV